MIRVIRYTTGARRLEPVGPDEHGRSFDISKHRGVQYVIYDCGSPCWVDDVVPCSIFVDGHNVSLP